MGDLDIADMPALNGFGILAIIVDDKIRGGGGGAAAKVVNL